MKVVTTERNTTNGTGDSGPEPTDRYADFSLDQWMTLTLPELVKAHLGLDTATMAVLSSSKPIVVR
jgi:hypothetical protein